MKSNEKKLRADLLTTMRKLAASGLNEGTAGNASVRLNDGFLMTPTGIAPEDLSAESMVPMSFDGTHSGDFQPSSEWRMHGDLLKRRGDINAVVHCHSRYATTLACAGKSIPPLHYMNAVTGGGDIRIAPYAIFGSQQLADHIFQTLSDRYACLMANHGQIATGTDLAHALSIANQVEIQSSFYYGTLAIGGPTLLAGRDIAAVEEKFKTYGQQSDHNP